MFIYFSKLTFQKKRIWLLAPMNASRRERFICGLGSVAALSVFPKLDKYDMCLPRTSNPAVFGPESFFCLGSMQVIVDEFLPFRHHHHSSPISTSMILRLNNLNPAPCRGLVLSSAHNSLVPRCSISSRVSLLNLICDIKKTGYGCVGLPYLLTCNHSLPARWWTCFIGREDWCQSCTYPCASTEYLIASRHHSQHVCNSHQLGFYRAPYNELVLPRHVNRCSLAHGYHDTGMSFWVPVHAVQAINQPTTVSWSNYLHLNTASCAQSAFQDSRRRECRSCLNIQPSPQTHEKQLDSSATKLTSHLLK